MRKNDLLKLPKLCVTRRIRDLVNEDKPHKVTVNYHYCGSSTKITYERYQYYRAIVRDGILKVAIFSRKLIAKGNNEPEFEIFISKDEGRCLTLETATGKWRTAKIDMLGYDIDQSGRYYGNKPWYTKDTKRIVNEYLGTGMLEVKDAILKFQSNILKENLKRKHKNELDKIDMVMSTVPDLPKDFDDWVLKSAFIHERYIFYKAGTKKGYCTHCKQEVEMKIKPLHNAESKCPHCHSNVILKSWKKQKQINDEKTVGIIQKLTDNTGYVVRMFKCRLKRSQENAWILWFAGCWEERRIIFDKFFRKMDEYYWGQYKFTRVDRWCKGEKWAFYYRPSEECVLYHRNVKKIRKEIGVQYVPIEELFRHKQGCYCYPSIMFRKILNKPKAEYLIKAGLYNMAWEILQHEYNDDGVNWSASKPWDMLRITKEQFKQCIRINATTRMKEVIKKAGKSNVLLTDEQVKFFTKKVGPNLIEKLVTLGHLEKFKNYFEKELRGNREIQDYFDYLEDLKKLRIPRTKNNLFPSNFQNTHQQIALQRQEKENAIQKMEIAKKDELLQKMVIELKEIYYAENENFVIILPTCKEDFNREGRENHNCVGGSYYDKMLKGNCVVMFLRKKEDPTKAFCTVEMDGSRIVQCRGSCNREAPKEAMDFMNKFAKAVKKRIAEKEKKLAAAG